MLEGKSLSCGPKVLLGASELPDVCLEMGKMVAFQNRNVISVSTIFSQAPESLKS